MYEFLPWIGLGVLLLLCLPILPIQHVVLVVSSWVLRVALVGLLASGAYLWFRPGNMPASVWTILADFPGLIALLPERGSQAFALCLACWIAAALIPILAALDVARRGIELVYGGGNVGLMGAIADAVLEHGGRVRGVIPRALVDKELAHAGCTEMVVVDSMHARKAKMAELSDAFVALPGGFGTFEEFFEVVTWSQLGLHAKPCGLLDVAGYYRPLVALIDHAVEHGFVRAEHRAEKTGCDMGTLPAEVNVLVGQFQAYRDLHTAR